MKPVEQKTEKQYWRSLDQLSDTPEFRNFLHREFPEGASEFTSEVDRRKFLLLMAAGIGMASSLGVRGAPLELRRASCAHYSDESIVRAPGAPCARP